MDLRAFVDSWIASWNAHDLEGVLAPMAEDVVFEHWTGSTLRGKRQLQLAWGPWFANHGDFHFKVTSLCASAAGDAFSFEWELNWPMPGAEHSGQRERRAGIDYVDLRNGVIVAKRSYTKIAVIGDKRRTATADFFSG